MPEDIELFYEEYGEGFPLILLHGNGGNHNEFYNQINDFSKYFHVYALDTRGHGNSPLGEKKFSIYTFADDLFDFMNEHNIKKAHILGFSDGANIAMCFAIKHSNMIDKLILNSGNYYPKGMIDSLFIELKNRYSDPALSLYEKDLIRIMLEEPNLTKKDLKTITCNSFVLVGKDDLIKLSHSQEIANTIPNCYIKVINGDHLALENNPIDFNRESLDFLLFK